MSMTMFFKKGRLIWEEYTQGLSNLCIEPKISFDTGITWMTLLSKATNLRTGSRVSDSSIKYLGEGWKQLDVGFSFSPYSIPAIVNHSVTADAVNGKTAGTYYYILRCLNKTSPGLEETSNNTYDALNAANNHSRVYVVTIEEKSNITLFVNFAEYVSGIALYEGYSADGSTFPITLKLSYISNLCNQLLETVEIADTAIWLKNAFPFPKEGIVKINNEYIKYSNCTYEEKIIDEVPSNYWKLAVNQRGYLNSTPAKHLVSEDPFYANVPVMIANHTAGFYGELPDKQFSKPVITDVQLKQFLNFDEKEVQELVLDNETRLPVSSPTKLGQILWDNTTINNGYALRLAEKGIIDTNVNLAKTMTIYTKFRLESLPSFDGENTFVPASAQYDPIIFGNKESLWLAVSRLNGKPYLGYKGFLITTMENTQMQSIVVNEYHSIGISWTKDENSDYMKFSIYLNGRILQTIVSTIKEEDFEENTIYIGGFKITEEIFERTISAFYDEWRIYTRILGVEDYNKIELERSKLNNIWCGKLELNTNSLTDYSVIDASTALNTYDPLFTLSYTFGSSELLYGSGSDFSTVYDDTLLQAFVTDGAIPSSTTFTYPIDTNKIQVRFDMEGDGTGFVTPKIRNIALIVSEGSIS